MTKYYFIRHGENDTKELNTRFYKGIGSNMLTLSKKGIEEIKETSKDERLKKAKIIVTSPFGRALHSSAILSKELGIDLVVETLLHEWLADINYESLSDEETYERLKLYFENNGENPNSKYSYESRESIVNRVNNVLKKYKNYDEVIIITHGVVISSFLQIPYPKNGDISEYIFN